TNGERVVRSQQPLVRIPEDLDHHRELHRARGVEAEVGAQQQRVWTRQALVVDTKPPSRAPGRPAPPVARAAGPEPALQPGCTGAGPATRSCVGTWLAEYTDS